MAERIIITAGSTRFQAQLHDTPTARAIMAALPIEARANRWGDEVYFSIPVKAGLEGGARDTLEVGELAYWPPGQALCIFFGPTPASEGAEPRAASSVNIVGRIEAEPNELRSVSDGAKITLQLRSEGE